MFKCQKCDIQVQPNVGSSKLVVATRTKMYTVTSYNEKSKKEYYKTAQGKEIVRELTVCPTCYSIYKKETDDKKEYKSENTYRHSYYKNDKKQDKR